MVAVITGHNLSEPDTDVGHRLVHAATQLRLNGTQLGRHALLRRFPPDGERSIAPALPAVVREAQECKGLRLPLPTIMDRCILRKVGNPVLNISNDVGSVKSVLISFLFPLCIPLR
jgi:hypothetical protein